MPSWCSTCRRPLEEHPTGPFGPYCELIFVEDKNGKTVECDTPGPRTKQNNKRWIHISQAPAELR